MERSSEMHKVYIASCVEHAPFWKELHAACPSIHFTARWPYFIGQMNNLDPDLAANFWVHDETDVRAADTILVYGPAKDNLRGAICEAGMGIVLGKKIYIVGDSPSFSTWQYHPQCVKPPDLRNALLILGATSSALMGLEKKFPEYITKPHL